MSRGFTFKAAGFGALPDPDIAKRLAYGDVLTEDVSWKRKQERRKERKHVCTDTGVAVRTARLRSRL